MPLFNLIRMRKFILIFSVCSFFQVEAQKTTFHRIITDSSFSYSTYFSQLLKNQDNSFLIIGTTVSYSNNKNKTESIITKLGANDSILWIRKYDYDNLLRNITVIKKIENNNYLLAGGYNYNWGLLIKVDSLGKVLWANTYDSCVITTIDIVENNYFLTGLQTNRSNTFIIKADTTGNVIWSKTIASYTDLIRTSTVCNNEIFMAGDARSVKADSTLSAGVFITRIDTNGDIKWTKGYNMITRGGTPRKIIPTKDSCFIIYFGPQNLSTFYQGLLKIDKYGNVIWCKEYHTTQMYNEILGGGL